MIFFLLLCLSVEAQIVEPVKWQHRVEWDSDSVFTLTIEAQIDKGWHLYATEMKADGPVKTAITAKNAKAISPLNAEGKLHSQYDEMFLDTVAYYENKVIFKQQWQALDDSCKFDVIFMACNDVQCTPPNHYIFSVNGLDSDLRQNEERDSDLRQNEERGSDLRQNEGNPHPELVSESHLDSSLWTIFLLGLLGGLIAIFTPCVWPIIPMTVSFFIKKQERISKTKGRGNRALKDALLYGLAIIIIYVGLGLIITLLMGASALNDISTNAWLNLFFFVLLVVFALSFFGAFEITLPASWSTKLTNASSSKAGFLSVLLMAFTLVIVSFSCTGPIIGTLLVEVSSNSFLAPTVGMLGFSITLAIPFALCALFPNIIKRLPKSGGWMNRLKVTLAFVELAFALKFFSVADMVEGWGLLSRETFIVLWIIIFLLLGLYLLGVYRFPYDDEDTHISVPRFMLAFASLAFALYMIPGLFGAPVKAISAFAPPATAQVEQWKRSSKQSDMFDFKADKPILLDFSGFGCVNCRKMEAAVFANPQVAERLKNYEIITLMVDDKERLAEPIVVEENGKQITLETIGEKWSYVQRSRFGSNAQPFYIQLSPEGETISKPYGYDEDIDDFLDWLKY